MKWFDDFRQRHADGRVAEWWEKISPYLPPINFITVHYAYFIFVSLFFALVFWGSGSPASIKIDFLDSLFLTTSALTSTGLNTINISQMSLGQQIVIFLAMLLGHPVLMSLWTLLFRRHVFEKRFRAVVKAERERKMRVGSSIGLTAGFSELLALARLRSLSKSKSKGSATQLPGLGTRIPTIQAPPPDPVPKREPELDMESGLAPIREGQLARTPGARSVTFAEPPQADTDTETGDGGLEFQNFLEQKRKNVGRNGEFFDLTLTEREYLGGVEYRAVEVLVITVALYYVLWQLLGALALGSWLAVNAPEISAVNQQNSWWSGIFMSVSAFSGCGLTLLDAGMTAFQSGYYFILIVMSLVIIAGSQASPILLRFITWVLSRVLRLSTNDENHAVWKETFDFILRYPRRVYIGMFPARPTWTLTLWLGGFVALDWIMFFLLNIGNENIESIPPSPRVIDGFFQSVSNLTAGFAVVSVSSVYFGLQILWLVKLYASAYPTSITVRGSNVYEERSLGIYAGDDPADSDDEDDEKKREKQVPMGAGGLFVSPGPSARTPLPSSPRSATSNSSRLSRLSQASRGGIDRIVGIGREGGAMLGRQLQRRMTSFQGVGVARQPQRKRINMPQTAQSTPHSSVTSSTASVGSLEEHPATSQDLVAHHVRSQLSHDVWWVALAFFLITVIETGHTLEDPTVFSLFNILFEIISAYANNGISVGLPHASYSFSGAWRGGSKFILILVMLRGRHRDLPVALDRAVKLPSPELDDQEDDDAEIRRMVSKTPRLGMLSPAMTSPSLIRRFEPM